jgi:hypothetical protein
MEIDIQALDTCEVASDGTVISIGLVNSKGRRCTIRLSLPQVGALLMTLPGVIDQALRNRFGDPSLRYAYQLTTWVLEQSSDQTQNLVTLHTLDGFSVCFLISRVQQAELAEALVSKPASTPRAN